MSRDSAPSQRPRVGQVLDALDELAPFRLAEEWDNVGLLVGDPAALVTGILVALDVTPSVLVEAKRQGCNLIVAHHPLLFHPLAQIRADDPTAALVMQAIVADVAVIACHTNLDKVDAGVNGALASALGLQRWDALERTADGGEGFGLIGDLAVPVEGAAFIHRIGQALGCRVVRVAGPVPEQVARVAACGGSGSSLARLAQERGADIYCCGEVKHDVGRWAETVGFCIVDAGHWATEQVVVRPLAARLEQRLAARGLAVEVAVSDVLADAFVVMETPGQEGVPFVK